MSAHPPQLFDSAKWQTQRDRAAPGFERHNFLKQLAASRLAERLAIVRRDFTDILDYGCHTGEMGRELHQVLASGPPFRLTQTDISPVFAARAEQANSFAVRTEICTDETVPEAHRGYDLIVSALYLQWMNDLPGLLAQMRRALRPDGLLLVNFAGGRTLSELRRCLSEAETQLTGGLSPRCMPMADIRDAGGLLQRAGFALPVADAEMLTVTYPDLFAVMRELRGMGAQNALSGRLNRFTQRQLFLRAAELYSQHFSTDDGQITLSVELITLTGWAPHDSQPRPLPRGSAKQPFGRAFG